MSPWSDATTCGLTVTRSFTNDSSGEDAVLAQELREPVGPCESRWLLGVNGVLAEWLRRTIVLTCLGISTTTLGCRNESQPVRSPAKVVEPTEIHRDMPVVDSTALENLKKLGDVSQDDAGNPVNVRLIGPEITDQCLVYLDSFPGLKSGRIWRSNCCP